MSITTATEIDGIWFIHDGTPDDGELSIVVDLQKVEEFNDEAHKASSLDKVIVENDNVLGRDTLTLTLPYNVVRDFVLGKLRDREVAVLEGMNGTELANYYIGLGSHNDPYDR